MYNSDFLKHQQLEIGDSIVLRSNCDSLEAKRNLKLFLFLVIFHGEKAAFETMINCYSNLKPIS